MLDKWRKKIESFDYASNIARFLGAYFFISLMISFFSNYDLSVLSFSTTVNMVYYLSAVIVLFVLLTMVKRLINSNIIDSYFLFLSSLLYFVYYLFMSSSLAITIVFSIIMIFIIIYLMKDDKLRIKSISLSKRNVKIAILVIALVYVIGVSIFSVLDYKSYMLATYDVGIFGQMYHYLTKCFIPYTTCERDYLLTHFAVHMSPIYYVLIPFYAIFPSIITLQILQPVIISLGVIPIYLICKNHNIGNKTTVLMAFIYCFVPAMASGCSFAFHENLFLAPLMLWLIYLFEKRSKFLFVPLLLCLMVKEDATIYTCIISLFFLINKKEYRYGILSLVISVVYFFVASAILSSLGAGLMSYRLNNFMTDDSLFSIIKVIFTNPGYFCSQLLTGDKLTFFLQMVFPLLFIPFFTKKIWRFILLIPFVLINLMPDYLYQFNIYFQYVFGSTTLLIYLVILNIEELPEKSTFKLSLFTTCLLMSASIFYPLINDSKSRYDYFKESSEIIDAELAKLDKDKIIVASCYILPHLCNYDEIYDLDYPYAKTYQADYIIFDRRISNDLEQYERYINVCKSVHLYYEIVDIDNVITILAKP